MNETKDDNSETLPIKSEENSGSSEDATPALDQQPLDDDKNGDKPLDPYAYVSNQQFTSEKFKILIRKLPKFYGLRELRKFLNVKLQLNCNKVKPPGRKTHWGVYACFRSDEERAKAIEVLNGIKWKGAVLEAKEASPAPDPFIKRKNEESNENPAKRRKIESEEQLGEAILDSVTPLHRLSYEDQLEEKFKEAKTIIKRLGGKLSKCNANLRPWLNEQKKLNDGFICKLDGIKSLASHNEKYRNKCEFSIGTNELTGKRSIGLRLGTYASGSVSVAPIDAVKFIPDIMARTVKLFEKFVLDSEYEVFSPRTLEGHWRQLTVRCGTRSNQLMVIVGFHPQELTLEKLTALKESIKNFFTTGDGSTLNVNSLYFEIIKRRDKGGDLPPPELLSGSPHIEEVLCGLTFKISPESFFQINTFCNEILLDSVKELSKITPETVVVDVCCGTGTIGLCLAKECKKVLGVEIVEKAIQNAKENANRNEIKNCEFFCGKADEILSSVVKRARTEDLVAIVDPPRAGLHQKAVAMLRETENLNRIVFLSCDCKSAFRNFTELGRAQSKTLLGDPFVPVRAVPVDMFPHTRHFEFVIYFERLRANEINKEEVKEENVSTTE